MCLGLVFCSNIFQFFDFLKLFSFKFYFLFSIIEIFQMPSTENYIQVHNSVVCLEGTLLCPAAFWGHVFFFNFFNHFLYFTFSFAKGFSFNYLITFLVSFIWNSQKCPVSQNIWCLIKTQLKNHHSNIFFKGVVHEQPWYIIVWFVWMVHYCVLLLSWGHVFLIFSIISLAFSFANVFSFYIINYFLSFFHLKFSEMSSFPKYMMPY